MRKQKGCSVRCGYVLFLENDRVLINMGNVRHLFCKALLPNIRTRYTCRRLSSSR